MDQPERIEVFAAATQTPMEARHSEAAGMSTRQGSQNGTTRYSSADRNGCVDRFVGRPQSARMVHRHNGFPRDRACENDDAVAGGQYGLPGDARKVDAAMTW